jgi:hypothetical protein
MKKNVELHPASETRPCHWCKAGFVFVANQAHGTGRTVLCVDHMNQFVATFHQPEPEPRDGV